MLKTSKLTWYLFRSDNHKHRHQAQREAEDQSEPEHDPDQGYRVEDVLRSSALGLDELLLITGIESHSTDKGQ